MNKLSSSDSKDSELLDDPLNGREREIFQRWCAGRSLRQIAKETGLSVRGVSSIIRLRMAEIIKDQGGDENNISHESGAQADTQPRGGATSIAERKLEQMLLKAGLLSEVPPQITNFTSYQKRKPIRVKGKPVSETIIEERR